MRNIETTELATKCPERVEKGAELDRRAVGLPAAGLVRSCSFPSCFNAKANSSNLAWQGSSRSGKRQSFQSLMIRAKSHAGEGKATKPLYAAISCIFSVIDTHLGGVGRVSTTMPRYRHTSPLTYTVLYTLSRPSRLRTNVSVFFSQPHPCGLHETVS